MRTLHVVVVALVNAQIALGQATWCNKNYMKGQPATPPGGEFPVPSTSSTPLIRFLCSPAEKPYISTEKNASILIDSLLTNQNVTGTFPFNPTNDTQLSVIVSMDGRDVVAAQVPLNSSTPTELSFSLDGLTPSTKPFEVTCFGTVEGEQNFTASSSLLFLPAPENGTVTKLDGRTGAVLAQNGTGWAPIFPIGFYTNYGDFVAQNLSALDHFKELGYNVVHLTPGDPDFGDPNTLTQVLDHMEDLGLWLIYDMRNSYMNASLVEQQVNTIKSRKNLLLWYTADEPDGWGYPLNSTAVTANQIRSLDGGGLHPVSLVLNCQDYEFTAYTQDNDIILQDTYPIGINATHSVRFDTPCTPDVGDCGCDNCKGEFEDISTRMDEFAFRLDVLGRQRTSAVWAVPQAFGGSEYWSRPPTGREWVVESVLAINHGALGITPWNQPTTSDIDTSASILANALPTISQFLFHPNATHTVGQSNRVDIGTWDVDGERLVLLTNMNEFSVNVTVGSISSSGQKVSQILDSGGSISSTGSDAVVQLDGIGTAGFVFIS